MRFFFLFYCMIFFTSLSLHPSEEINQWPQNALQNQSPTFQHVQVSGINIVKVMK